MCSYINHTQDLNNVRRTVNACLLSPLTHLHPSLLEASPPVSSLYTYSSECKTTYYSRQVVYPVVAWCRIVSYSLVIVSRQRGVALNRLCRELDVTSSPSSSVKAVPFPVPELNCPCTVPGSQVWSCATSWAGGQVCRISKIIEKAHRQEYLPLASGHFLCVLMGTYPLSDFVSNWFLSRALFDTLGT
jgi:hypothetical protein